MSLIGQADTPASYVADYMQACVGMLGIPAGGFTADIEAYGAATSFNVESLYAAMLNSSIGRSIYTPGASNTTLVTKLVDKLGGSLLSDATKAAVIDLGKSMLDGGDSLAKVAMTFVEAVSNIDTTDPDYGAVAQQFANRIEIANYYTFSSTAPSTTLSSLSAILTGVTNTTDVSNPAAVLDANTDPAVSTGQTFTLTTALDTIIGTTGADTIKGDFTSTATINAGDSIAGGAGNDLLQLFGTYAAANMPMGITGVETLQFGSAQADAAVDLSTWTKATTGIENVIFDNVAALSGKTITTTAGQSLALATGPSMAATAGTVTWAGSATDTTLNLTLNGYQGAGSEAALTVTGAADTTMNIIANGTAPSGQSYANQISTLTVPATATKLVITGAGGLEVSTNTVGTKLAEIDASATTKGVSMVVDGTAAALKFTGGTGNDTVTFGTTNTFTTADTVVGGDGSDTLEMQRAQSANTAAAFTNITGFETLKVTDATSASDIFNLDHFGVQNINFKTTVTGTTTVSNMLDNATLTLGTTSNVALTLKTNTTADDLTIKVGGAGVTYTIDSSHFENLSINTSAATGTSTFAITDPQMKSVTLSNKTASGTYNDQAVDLGTLGVVVDTVNLSDFKPATATNGVTVILSSSAVNGATVTGSGNNDNITGSSQDDSITAGEGADTITGGSGNDTIDLTETTAAIDNFIFSAAASNGTDTIIGFAEGTGIDTLTLLKTDTTVATAGAAAVLGASTAALVTGGGAYTTTSSTTTSDVVEITTVLDTAVTLSATSTGADLLQALSSDTTAASGITATTANDKAFFLVYQNDKAFLFFGDANGGGAGGTSLIEASEIKLVGVINDVANGGIASGDILMSA